jgi:MFS family permease
MLASTVTTPMWGKLGDLVGRKTLFLLAIIVFLGGSVLCGTAQNMVQLVLYRAIQGLGGGGLTVLSQPSSEMLCRLASEASTKVRLAPFSGSAVSQGPCSAASSSTNPDAEWPQRWWLPRRRS